MHVEDVHDFCLFRFPVTFSGEGLIAKQAPEVSLVHLEFAQKGQDKEIGKLPRRVEVDQDRLVYVQDVIVFRFDLVENVIVDKVLHKVLLSFENRFGLPWAKNALKINMAINHNPDSLL